MVKKKATFKRIDKNTGIESEISTATAAENLCLMHHTAIVFH